MLSEHELPRLPMDWPDEEARSLPVGATYEYRPNDARLSISWKVDPGTDFSPESEALAIATLLEQAQGFTRAFDLANLPRVRLIHQAGQWAPGPGGGNWIVGVRAEPNGNGVPAPTPNSPCASLSPTPALAIEVPPPPEPPPPLPQEQPEPDDAIPYIQQFTDPVLVQQAQEGRSPDSFEDWVDTRARLLREQEGRKRAEQHQANALRTAGRPETPPHPEPPTPNPRSLDEMIEDAEAEGRLLPTRPEKKPVRPKRRTHGASMDLNDQIMRLMRHTARPVYATYVARQLNLPYHQAYDRLQRLAVAGEVERRERKTDQGKTGYEFMLPERKP